MGFFDNLADKIDDVKRDARRAARNSTKKLKSETAGDSVFDAVTKKAGTSIGNAISNINNGVDEGYAAAMNHDPIRICIKMAQVNPLTSPMIYTGYTRALNEKLSDYDDGEFENFSYEVGRAIRGYKYEKQAMIQINKILSRR